MAKQVALSVIGLLPRDHGGASIQTAGTFRTDDSSTTPKSSPLGYSATIIVLVVPDDAVQLVLKPSTDLRVSEQASMSRYYVVTAGSAEAFAVALQQNVYIRRDSADGTVSFRFAEV